MREVAGLAVAGWVYVGGVSAMLSFGVRLGRLLERRGRSAGALALAADVTVAGVGVVLAGEDPSPVLLRRLAPALDLHTADLFLFAGRTLPADLAPSLLTGPFNVGSLLYWHNVYNMPAPVLAELSRFVATLPDLRTPRTSPWPADDRGPGPGAVLWRLIGNRNIRLDLNVMMPVGGGPYVSTSTYAMVLRGGRPLTAEYVNAFARVLGLAIGDLTALLGLASMDESAWSMPYEPPVGIVELAWDARRLTDEQLRQTMRRADELTSQSAS